MKFGPEVHNFGNAHLVEPGVPNRPVMAIGMWGYTPVGLTGVLVIFYIIVAGLLENF